MEFSHKNIFSSVGAAEFILILICLTAPLQAVELRIGLQTGIKDITLSSPGGFKVFVTDNPEVYTIRQNSLRVTLEQGNFIASHRRYTETSGLRIKACGGGYLSIGSRRYRGEFMISKHDGSFSVINLIELEDYLRGVVPSESPASFELEAMKAQAVVARTYVLGNLGRHQSDGFDLCSSEHCQAYGGMSNEKAEADKAVFETKGMVLSYNGLLAEAVYHSSCGGHTSSASTVWGGKGYPYLTEVECEYCKDAPHSKWEYRISRERLAEALRRKGSIQDNFLKIEVLETDDGGRVKLLSVNQNLINANTLRTMIGSDKIYSNCFKIYENEPNYEMVHGVSLEEKVNHIIDKYEKSQKGEKSDEIIFLGYGSGHGVGLCQWGANGMARLGTDYCTILSKYYPGTRMVKFSRGTLGQQLVKR
ncbi:MAG: SpoIID/LytB domain-containing protein [Candidatus Wallbacteria bacterium]|nr:SpoIID/LytB domain-containing protein [Candidatus Wallbacteria bacterium]